MFVSSTLILHASFLFILWSPAGYFRTNQNSREKKILIENISLKEIDLFSLLLLRLIPLFRKYIVSIKCSIECVVGYWTCSREKSMPFQKFITRSAWIIELQPMGTLNIIFYFIHKFNMHFLNLNHHQLSYSHESEWIKINLKKNVVNQLIESKEIQLLNNVLSLMEIYRTTSLESYKWKINFRHFIDSIKITFLF